MVDGNVCFPANIRDLGDVKRQVSIIYLGNVKTKNSTKRMKIFKIDKLNNIVFLLKNTLLKRPILHIFHTSRKIKRFICLNNLKVFY